VENPAYPKNSINFPITNTICEQWANCSTYSPIPQEYGVHIIPKGIVIGLLNYAESNGYLKILMGYLLGGKGGVECS